MKENEYVIINETQILKRIEELESACIELFNLVHDSEGRIEYKIRANDLYDVAQHKEIKSTPLIPEIQKAFDEGQSRIQHEIIEKLGLRYQTQQVSQSTILNMEVHSDEYISNLKLDI